MSMTPVRRPHLPHRTVQRGVAAIEFALLATLLLTLTLGAAEFGRALYQYNTVVKNTRAAVRYLSAYAPGNSAAAQAAANLVVYGTTTAGNTPLVPGLRTSLVSVQDATNDDAHALVGTGRGVIDLVTVTVSGLHFVPLASWVLPAFTYAPISATMRQGV
jgi:Flp pilus assembly protein TadG